MVRSIPYLAALASFSLLVPAAAPDERRGLSDADFKELHGPLISAKEPWEAIPWRLSVREAQADAAKEKKPVYMLVRSGHPLGCV